MTPTGTNKKELLAINHNMLKALHDVYRYDFNKVYSIRKHTGKFTAKSLVKNGFIPESYREYQIVILIKRPFVRTANSLYSVKFFGNGELDTEVTARYSDGLDTYWRKLDFNDDRKCDETVIYIVIQHNEDLTPTKRLEDRPCNRAKIVYVETESDDYKYMVYLNYGDGKHDRSWDYHWYKKDDLCVTIDKSGYFLQPVRRALSRRAEERKARREKESYYLVNNTAKIEEMKSCLNFIADTLKKRVDFAETVNDWNKISECINSFWSGFPHTLELFEELKEREEKKDFRSQSNFESALAEIKNRFEELCKKLFTEK